ncbi:cytochrome b-c1 complex subunit 10 [Halyomorpha halys]|uniref:cytochrome b-c1 complex subunit 10 n=1 Tax=Halyomorpha halys TaxID=286706 RepID=UPI000D0C8AD3|nr:cytochrome b-c1 complex subunit 10 [Halyomorpha halys]
MISKKLIFLLPKWIPSLSLFGASAGAAVCYATDWKLVLEYMPYYGGKFKTEEEADN